MKKLDLAQAVSVLANVGVIAGIVFLGLELQQNNELLTDEAQRARAQSFRENMGVWADNAELWARDLEGETLTSAEAFRISRIWMMNLWAYQTSFLQLPRNEVEGAGILFSRQFESMPSLRATWAQNRDAFEPDFVQYMEEDVFDRH